MRTPLLISAVVATTFFAIGSSFAASPRPSPALVAAIKATTRTPANAMRDAYRHPAETLTFFGVKSADKVVEIWPSGGWYTEILAPYVRTTGSYTAAAPSENARKGVVALQTAKPALYDKIKFATFPAADAATGVPGGSVDVVLTFRNVHNWRFAGEDKTQAAFNQMFAMLKPGGTLGVVEHHLPEAMDSAMEQKSGYMKKSSVVGFATKAGFKLVGESGVNANPKDGHDYPKGVWTLPPNYAEKDVDRAKYTAIGESDRMTLKFMKPRK